MTTIAWDGRMMAGDTKTVDVMGLKNVTTDKVKRGKDFLAGSCGNRNDIALWWREVKDLTVAEILERGYTGPEQRAFDDWIGIMIACESGIWINQPHAFCRVEAEFYAIGSGRDYALMAMHLGRNARDAIALTAVFDNNTGSDVLSALPPWLSPPGQNGGSQPRPPQ